MDELITLLSDAICSLSCAAESPEALSIPEITEALRSAQEARARLLERSLWALA